VDNPVTRAIFTGAYRYGRKLNSPETEIFKYENWGIEASAELQPTLRDKALELIAREYQIPVKMLTGNVPSFHDERDVRKFYAQYNATFKGWRRRCRQHRAFIQKLAHKKH
jgi:hypothetical protein